MNHLNRMSSFAGANVIFAGPWKLSRRMFVAKKRTCITSYTSFSNICPDRDILEVCIKARCDLRADEFNFSMESFRKAAYRQYALWTYGKLGRGNRRVIPAYVVRMIRQTYLPLMADIWALGIADNYSLHGTSFPPA